MSVLRRRWLVVLMGGLVGIGLMYGTTKVIPADTSISATVLLLPPKVERTDGQGLSNPYLQLGGLTPPTEVLARALNDPAVHDEVIPRGSGTEYLAERDLSTSAPILTITVQGQSLEEARRVRDVLLKRTPEELRALQQSIGVPSNAQLTSSLVTLESPPVKQNKSLIRAMLVVGAGTGALTVGIAGALDAVLLRRRDPARSPRHAPTVSTSTAP